MCQRSTDRKIIHLDLDAFYCAVEAQRDPALRGKAFAVGGQPDARGVVASCSYAARRHGVRSAMPMARALQRCPTLIVVPGNHDIYEDVSRQVMARLYNLSDLVEQISIDEAFLDVSDLRAPVANLARELQATIWDELALPCSLGAATNKLVAKIANNVGKAEAQTGRAPMSIKIVPPGQEAAFLAPLPVRELWGIGPKTAEKLAALGVRTIGDLARWPAEDLARRFGQHGRDLARRARGIDARPIVTEHEAKSFSREVTYARDVTEGDVLRRTLSRLSASVGHRLRRAGVSGSTVKLKLRWSDFTTLTRQVTLDRPTDLDDVIYTEACQLLEATWPRGKAVRLIGVGVSNLGEPAQQLGLWETPDERGERLQAALDTVRERFGYDAIQRAVEIKAGQGGES